MDKLIYLTKGRVAVVDEEDFEELSKHKWCVSTGYAVRRLVTNGIPQLLLMHRVIMNASKGQEIDHINGDRLDNRKANLRFVTRQQNIFNKKPQGKTSKYKGVYFRKSWGKWIAQISINKKKQHIGVFENELDAARAYDNIASKLCGEYARLNGVD